MSTNKMKISSRGKRIAIRICLILLGLLVLLVLAISIVLHTVVSPKKITPIVLEWANETLDAQVKCESIDVTFFSTFPNLGIRFQDGNIVKKIVAKEDSAYHAPHDTLVAFHSFTVSFAPVAFLFHKKIIIHELKLDRPDIYAFVDLDGKTNWDIIKPEEDDQDTIKSEFQRPQLDVKNIKIIKGNIIYEDLKQNLFVKTDSLHLELDGNMSKDSTGLDLKLGMKALTAYSEGQRFTDNLPLDIKARLKNNKIEHRLTINQAQFTVGVLSFDAKGNIQREKPGVGFVDVNFKLSASSLSELLASVPKHLLDVKDELKTTGAIESYGSLKGLLGKDNYPVLEMSVNLKDGSLRSSKSKNKSGLKKIELACNTKIDFSGNQPSFLHIDSLYLKSSSSEIALSGEVSDIFTKPVVNTHFSGNVDFNRLSQDFSFVAGAKMGGNIDLDLSAKCFVDDILSFNYGKVDANGKIDVENVFYKDTVNNISFLASGGSIRLGSNVKDTIRGQLRESLLRGNIALDSINLNWKNELRSSAGRLSGWLSTSAPKDTATIAPVSGGIRLENMRLTMGDSIRMRAVKANAILKLASQEESPSKPEYTVRITLDSLRGRFLTMGGGLHEAKLSLKIRKHESVSGRNRVNIAEMDSARIMARRDSLRRLNQENNLSFQLASSEAKDALRQWDVSGSFECKSMSLRTPYYPLPMRMTQSLLNFTTNTLSFTEVHLKIGSSEMLLKGELEGIRRALLYNGKMTVKLSVDADSVNFNELIKAAVEGSEFVEKSSQQRDSISQVVLDESKVIAVVPDTVSGIFVIPGNIDVELDTKMNEAIYGKLRMNNASGKIIIKDRAVHLPDWKISSELGSARVSLVYKAADRKGARFGMDLGMRQIDVKELIGAFPMIDTLTPMLRSFEGVVDCDMTVLTEMDSMMNVRLPETTAACYMHGVNMVLLDGETFSEISKMLMFKNKKRNMIDSISVEMVLENSKIMIFPFLVSLDRYQAGVGGTQNLDMTFDYHITVLKSPLPFKLGLNVTGSSDKMKIRLAKAKYKDLFAPAKEQDLTKTKINLRQEMDRKLKKSIEDIVHQPAIMGLQKPTIELPDSLKKTFFQLDTTKVDYPRQEEPKDSISAEKNF